MDHIHQRHESIQGYIPYLQQDKPKKHHTVLKVVTGIMDPIGMDAMHKTIDCPNTRAMCCSTNSCRRQHRHNHLHYVLLTNIPSRMSMPCGTNLRLLIFCSTSLIYKLEHSSFPLHPKIASNLSCNYLLWKGIE